VGAQNGSVEEEIRTIVRSGEDVRNGWSDREIVREASQRAGHDTPDAALADRLEATVIAIRSETDNDGQTLRHLTREGSP
jgi:hypothetical protein